VAKMEGPEEFFEALRSAKRDRLHKPAPASGEAGSTQEPAQPVKPVVPAEPASEPVPLTPTATRRLPPSVLAKNEPTISLRRSTAIFCVLVVLVLLFIAFALGRRVGRAAPQQPAQATTTRNGMTETRRLAPSEQFRGKSAIFLKTFDRRDSSAEANARTYRDFLNTSPDAAFIRSANARAFIISRGRELTLCVGPFRNVEGPDMKSVYDKIVNLPYREVKQFGSAYGSPLPEDARLFDEEGENK